MDAVWGGVLAFVFVLATLAGYGAGTPPEKPDKEKSEQSDKQDEDKDKKDEDKKEESGKKDESAKDRSGKSDRKDKSGRKDRDNGASTKASKKKVEYCVKDCPDLWTLRQ